MTALVPAVVHFLDLCKCKPGTLRRDGKPYRFKKDDKRVKCHAHISRAMQSIESQIILECCSNLWEKDPKMFLVTLHDCIKCLPEDIETVREELKRTFNKYGIDPKLKKEFHGIEKIIEAKSCPPPPEAHGLKELFLAIEEQKKPTITKQEIADRFFNGTSIKTVERFLKKYPQLKKLKETDSNRIAYFPLDEIIKCLEQEKTSHARRNQ